MFPCKIGGTGPREELQRRLMHTREQRDVAEWFRDREGVAHTARGIVMFAECLQHFRAGNADAHQQVSA